MTTKTELGATYEAANKAYLFWGDDILGMKDEDPRAQDFLKAATAWAEELYKNDPETTPAQAIERAVKAEHGRKIHGLTVMLYG